MIENIIKFCIKSPDKFKLIKLNWIGYSQTFLDDEEPKLRNAACSCDKTLLKACRVAASLLWADEPEPLRTSRDALDAPWYELLLE